MPIQYPFGETWYSPSGAPLVFSSYYRDTKSGNDYAMARTYANRLGRFSAPDRHSGNQSNPQSLNRYAYSLNDPVNLADPSGMEPCELIVAKHRKWLERLEIAGLGPSNLPFDADFLGQDFPDGGCDLVGGGGGGGGGTSDPPLDDNYNPCDPGPGPRHLRSLPNGVPGRRRPHPAPFRWPAGATEAAGATLCIQYYDQQSGRLRRGDTRERGRSDKVSFRSLCGDEFCNFRPVGLLIKCGQRCPGQHQFGATDIDVLRNRPIYPSCILQ